ncbi:CotH protein [Candidatus Electrothrix aarhusensis]|uniref:CotH protein n=1 Tax=Candidatus Electrothrix aarhusensis TaxID=1859131 RepID=A0A3S3SHN3_9BACT|nr:CotH protein [Candidatus Electrothrix aarhusensis]
MMKRMINIVRTEFISFVFLLLVFTHPASAENPKVDAEKLFDNNSIPVILLYISPTQWNYLLNNFNTNSSNDQYIQVNKFIFQPMKDGKASGTPETLSDIQLKLKGNTSRICPESGSNVCGPHATGYGVFHQANFKLKFKNPETGDKQYLYGYDKLDLKSFKGQMSKTREIYSFQTLGSLLDKTAEKQFTLAPHISHAHLYIAIQGDRNSENAYNSLDASQKCESGYYCYDFGYYEMLEPVNSKAYMKTRFGNTKGYMWKGNLQNVCFAGLNIDTRGSCDLQSFTKTIDKAGSTNCASGEPCDPSIPFGIKNEPWDGKNKYKPIYDYQGKEEHFDKALNIFAAFIYNLNFLSTSSSDGQVSPLENWIINGVPPKDWDNPFDPDNDITYTFDYQSFLTTMAFDVAIGNWDGYWFSKNNYALYFDKENKTVSFIPNDYDTVLGSIAGGTECGSVMGTTQMDTFGLNSGKLDKRPLINRLLKIPTFQDIYKQAVNRIESTIDQTIAGNYPRFVQQYQLICKNFKQTQGANCSASDPKDYLCENPQYTNEGTDVTCDSDTYLTLPNQISGMNNIPLEAARGKIVADLPVWYGRQFYRLFSSTRYGTQKPTANFFLTTQFNIEKGYACE